MTNEIEALLRQRKWTGDQVGKLLIASAIHAYLQILEGAEPLTELFSADKLRKMVDSLTDPEQLQRYNRYVGLNNWLTQYQAVANAYMQRAEGRLLLLQEQLTTIQYVEYLCCLAPHVEPVNEMQRRAIEDASINCGLWRFTSRNREYPRSLEIAINHRTEVLEATRYLISYDAAIAMIAEYLGIEAFCAFQSAFRTLPSQSEALDKVSGALRPLLSRLPAGEREEKLRVFDAVFSPLRLDGLAVPEAVYARANAMLTDGMRAFEKQDGKFMRLLTDWECAYHG